MEGQTANASQADTIRRAREHYDYISGEARHWSSTIPEAISALEREPDLIGERDWLKERCERLERALCRAMIPLEVIYATEMDGTALCQALKDDIAGAIVTGRRTIMEKRHYVRGTD